jgi:hypothetical protein
MGPSLHFSCAQWSIRLLSMWGHCVSTVIISSRAPAVPLFTCAAREGVHCHKTVGAPDHGAWWGSFLIGFHLPEYRRSIFLTHSTRGPKTQPYVSKLCICSWDSSQFTNQIYIGTLHAGVAPTVLGQSGRRLSYSGGGGERKGRCTWGWAWCWHSCTKCGSPRGAFYKYDCWLWFSPPPSNATPAVFNAGAQCWAAKWSHASISTPTYLCDTRKIRNASIHSVKAIMTQKGKGLAHLCLTLISRQSRVICAD